MRAIRLDYAAPAAASVPGVAVLLAACVCAAMLWQYASALQQQTTAMQGEIVQAKRNAGIERPMQNLRTQSSAANVADAASISQAQQVAAFLLVPWSALFDALEAAALDDAVLLSVEPDAKKQQLTIIAEAKNKEVLFRYIERLEATPQLSRVYMLKHEVVQDSAQQEIVRQDTAQQEIAQQPIRFVLTATWKKAP